MFVRNRFFNNLCCSKWHLQKPVSTCSRSSISRIKTVNVPSVSNFIVTSNNSITGINYRRNFATTESGTAEKEEDGEENDESTSKGAADAKIERTIVKYAHHFEQVPVEHRTKEAFHNALGLFLINNEKRRGHVEFIYAALRQLEAYGLHRDLDTYKRLLEIFPKGKFIPENAFQRHGKHYPMQQDLCVYLLDVMEFHRVEIDKEVFYIVVNAFGDWNYCTKKIRRMMYWKPKLRHANPYLDRRHVEGLNLTAMELAVQALKMICRDPGNLIEKWLGESVDDVGESAKSWIVSGHSPLQSVLINRHPKDQPLYVDGPYRVYVMTHSINYFTLTADPTTQKSHDLFFDETPETAEDFRNWKTRWNSVCSDRSRAVAAATTIHEQVNETILACGATATSSKESAAVWISLLQKHVCARLSDLTVVFRLKHSAAEVVTTDSQNEAEKRDSLSRSAVH